MMCLNSLPKFNSGVQILTFHPSIDAVRLGRLWKLRLPWECSVTL